MGKSAHDLTECHPSLINIYTYCNQETTEKLWVSMFQKVGLIRICVPFTHTACKDWTVGNSTRQATVVSNTSRC